MLWCERNINAANAVKEFKWGYEMLEILAIEYLPRIMTTHDVSCENMSFFFWTGENVSFNIEIVFFGLNYDKL